MKYFYSLLAIVFIAQFSTAQTPEYKKGRRSTINPLQYPFYHGVASGDPLTDRVIIWTRITLDPPVDPVNVQWQVSTDTSFSNIVSSGVATTDTTKDYTIKVDASGLQPDQWYYYRFAYDTFYSITGRTRTLPTGHVNNLRFAVASCQDYQNGYYNAYKHMSNRNDLDAVLFLGDYIYEDGPDTVYNDRVHEPGNKCVQLVDYRIRHSQYRLDPDLQAAHQQYPWICVWDDHETANNSYTDGAKNHTQNDGPWYDRKVNGVETYYEWLPLRRPDLNDTFKIFRKFTWGDLADLDMLDTRLYDRDKQAVGQIISVYDSVLTDSTRTILGPEQMMWLNNNLDTSHAQWQVLGQQVIMAPLVIPAGIFGPPSIINADQWDGYPYDRQRFYDHVIQNNISNIVVLTGDIHTSWANDLPLPGYDSVNRSNSIGVEFVCSSITSNNEMDQAISEGVIMGLAQYVRYVDLTKHGYYVLDIDTNRVQADFTYVSVITSHQFTSSSSPSWFVNDGEKFLRQANAVSVPKNSYPPLAALPDVPTGITKNTDNITPVSIHPNPFYSQVVLQFNTMKPEEVVMKVFSSTGQLMVDKNLGLSSEGLNYATFDGSLFPTGYYQVVLQGKDKSVGKAIIKVN